MYSPGYAAGRSATLLEGETMRPNPYNAEKRRRELDKKKKKEEKKLKKALGKETGGFDEENETVEESPEKNDAAD